MSDCATLCAAHTPHTPTHPCQARLAQEQARCAAYLEPSSRAPLLAATEDALLGRHVGSLLERGFDPLLDAHRVTDLARLYGLLGRIGRLDALKAAWAEGVYKRVAAIVKDEPNVGVTGGV
jgi:cullin-4